MGPGFESLKAHQILELETVLIYRSSANMWPVGQAVKTAASHAANVGSIPARVTKFLLTNEGRSITIQVVAESDLGNDSWC